MDLDLIALLLAHKWLPAMAVFVGLLIRLLKDDTRGPSIPASARAPLAFVLGLAAGVLQRKAAGASWREAALAGVVTGLLPIVGHKLGIDLLRGGKEISVPGMMRDPSSSNSLAKGPTDAQ